MALAMATEAPTPNPVPMSAMIQTMGAMLETDELATEPRPEHHTVSAVRLIWTTMYEMMNGSIMLLRAFLGSPKRTSIDRSSAMVPPR